MKRTLLPVVTGLLGIIPAATSPLTIRSRPVRPPWHLFGTTVPSGFVTGVSGRRVRRSLYRGSVWRSALARRSGPPPH